NAEKGSPVAVSGPGRGFRIDTAVGSHLLFGDESALPAIAQLLESLPRESPVKVVIEVADTSARIELPGRAGVEWVEATPGEPPGTSMERAVEQASIDDDAHVWVAGEA